jgi:hypothetical protein
MGIEIRNTGSDVRGVLVGDPETPSTVKLLQPGETFVADDNAVVTINDGSSVRDRRANADPYGRRTGDPRVDQRQVRREKSSGAAVNTTTGTGATGIAALGNQSADGVRGTAATNPNTTDGTNVPKDAAGKQLT